MKTRTVTPLRTALLLGAFAGIAALGALAAGHRAEFPLSIADAEARGDARFEVMDRDGNGEINPEELAAAPRPFHHGPRGPHGWRGVHSPAPGDDDAATEAPEAALFDALDEDADGMLSREEFTPDRLREARRAAVHQRLFDRLDRDGSGGISRSELPDMSRRLADMDADGDGTVTRTEARAYHRRPGPQPNQTDDRG